MADGVQSILERMLPDLVDAQERGIFSADEVKAILSKRRDFEYRMSKRLPVEADYVSSIEYELSVDALTRARKRRLGLRKTTACDHACLRRIHFIFERALRHFRGQPRWWMQWVDFCMRSNGGRAADRVAARALQLHPRCAALWIIAAAWQFDSLGNDAAAMTLLQCALRLNRTDVTLWLALFQTACMSAMRAAGKAFLSSLTAAAAAAGGEASLIPLSALRTLTPITQGGEEEEAASPADLPQPPTDRDAPLASVEDVLRSHDAATGSGATQSRASLLPELIYDEAVRALNADVDTRVRFLTIADSFTDTLSPAAALTQLGASSSSSSSSSATRDMAHTLMRMCAPVAFPRVCAHILADVMTHAPTHPHTWLAVYHRTLAPVQRALDAYGVTSKRGAAAEALADDELFVVDTRKDAASEGDGDAADAADASGAGSATTSVSAKPSTPSAPGTTTECEEDVLVDCGGDDARRMQHAWNVVHALDARAPKHACITSTACVHDHIPILRYTDEEDLPTTAPVSTSRKRARMDVAAGAPQPPSSSSATAEPSDLCVRALVRACGAAEASLVDAAAASPSGAASAAAAAAAFANLYECALSAAPAYTSALRARALAACDAACSRALAAFFAAAATLSACDARTAAHVAALRVQCLLRGKDAAAAVATVAQAAGAAVRNHSGGAADPAFLILYANVLAHVSAILGEDVSAAWADMTSLARECLQSPAAQRCHAAAMCILMAAPNASEVVSSLPSMLLRAQLLEAEVTFVLERALRIAFSPRCACSALATGTVRALTRVHTHGVLVWERALAIAAASFHACCRLHEHSVDERRDAYASVCALADDATRVAGGKSVLLWQMYTYVQRLAMANRLHTPRGGADDVYARATRALASHPTAAAEFAASVRELTPGTPWEARVVRTA